MLLKLYQAGQPVLRQTAKPVTKNVLAAADTQALIDHMIETLRDAPGVGLAAPQVAQPLQIVVIEDKARYHKPVSKEVLQAQGRRSVQLKVLVNPRLEIVGDDQALFFEGCLSVDGYVAAVQRATTVKVTALDREGKDISYAATGWQARILQHEIDHLNGSLYIDNMLIKSFMTVKNFVTAWRDAPEVKIRKTFNG